MKHSTVALGYSVGWLSIIVNIILFISKFWIGVKFDSVAMRADAWHTLSDTLTSFAVVIGFWIASKPPDEEHPFGHGRAESICAIIIGVFLVLVAFNFLQETIESIQATKSVIFGRLAIIVFLISTIVKEGLAQLSFWAGKKINSQSLTADAWHHRSDAIASGIIVIGALIGDYFWWIDSAMGLGVSLLILYTAFGILKQVIDSLLGEEISPRLKQEILNLIEDIAPLVENIHHLHLHRYGDHKELTLHITLPADLSLKKAHTIATTVETGIKEQMKMEVTAHIDLLETK